MTTAIPIMIVSAPSCAIHRDEQQIRANFLHSLGFVRPTTSTTSTSRKETATIVVSDDDEDDESMIDECRQDECSITSTTTKSFSTALKYNSFDALSPKQGQQVSFCETVMVMEIPSHREYSPQDRLALWNSSHAVAALVQRNTWEFKAEGRHWQHVLEEDAFVTVTATTGELVLVHPATHQRLMEQERLRRKQRKQQRKQQQQKYAYKSVAQCLNFGATTPLLQPKISRRRKTSNKTTKRQQHAKLLVSLPAAQ